MWKLFDEAAHWLTSHAAHAYAASTLEEARRICIDLHGQGFGTSVCFWNDDSDSVDDITASCLRLLELLWHLDPHSYLSLKLPAMQFDAGAVTTILQTASRIPRRIHFDSHGPEHADRMFDTIECGLKHNRNLSCTIPGRWLRSANDARLAARLGLRVRVCKGQWADPRQPDLDARSGFLRVIDELCGRESTVAVATHDIPLAQEALHRLLCSGTPCELELLFGLPRRAIVDMARRCGVSVRFYVPQGKAWLPYLLSQARNNPQVVGWLLRDVVRGYACEARRFKRAENQI